MRGDVRRDYYVFLALYVAGVVGFALLGPLLLGWFFWPIWIAGIISIRFVGELFTCSWCDHPLVRPRVTVGSAEMLGYTQFPGKTCTNCGKDVSGG